MCKKDFSLLRPFDIEAAKRGEAVCWNNGDVGKFIAADRQCNVCIDWTGLPPNRLVLYSPTEYSLLCMAPLAWVEGKPVYKGDVLYDPHGKKVVKAANILEGWLLSEAGIMFNAEGCTWTPPKVKREIKLLAFIDDQGELRWVREELFANRGPRVPSEDKTVEVED